MFELGQVWWSAAMGWALLAIAVVVALYFARR
jgi:hypothetical protein